MRKILSKFYYYLKQLQSPNPIIKFVKKYFIAAADVYRKRGAFKMFIGMQLIDRFPLSGGDSRMYLVLPYLHSLPIRQRYASQCYQAMFVAEVVHAGRTDGVFLDVGANDPKKINNTCYLESLGWTGLAFEPIRTRQALWADSGRKTPCLPICLGRHEGIVTFCEYERDYMSGVADKVTQTAGEILRDKYEVPCRRLADVLQEHNITHVDYMSLDVEGSELDVLAGIDFTKCSFDCVSIENEGGLWQTWPIRIFMLDHGFRYCARLWQDDIFVSERIFSRLQ